MTVAEYLAYFIEKKEIKNVFQLSGGMITQLVDKISERKTIHIHSLLSRYSNFNSNNNITHNDEIIFNSIEHIDKIKRWGKILNDN